LKTFTIEDVNGFIRCNTCGNSLWDEGKDRSHCSSCKRSIPIVNGVLCPEIKKVSSSEEFYSFTGGAKFIEAGFADNITIYSSTRTYKKYLKKWFPSSKGPFLDLGCGDGRFSLWALEEGFSPVISLDCCQQSLERLANTASERNLKGLIPLRANFREPCLVPSVFNSIIAVETLCYLCDTYNSGLELIKKLLSPDGRAMISEFGVHGMSIIDTAAVNVVNMEKEAFSGRRLEKYGSRSTEARLFTPDEFEKLCVEADLEIIEKGGISPLPMLFNFAYNFTSYPLRPALDEKMKSLIDALSDGNEDISSLSRNILFLLKKRSENGKF